MSRNLLPCIIALFNVRVLHIFNMGRMALHNERWRFRWAVIDSLKLGVGDFGCGQFQNDKAFGLSDLVSDLSVFGIGVAPGRRGEAKDPRWIQKLVNVSKRALGSLNTCHHHGMIKF